MITCALCGKSRFYDGYCTPLAAITVHWMNDHPIEYGQRHPADVPYMPNHPRYEG